MRKLDDQNQTFICEKKWSMIQFSMSIHLFIFTLYFLFNYIDLLKNNIFHKL